MKNTFIAPLAAIALASASLLSAGHAVADETAASEHSLTGSNSKDGGRGIAVLSIGKTF